MASEFTQDAVLVFLQSRGGTVKNSDLVLHFRNFIRDHADQDRNRELFKKFVNSVATVKQLDGVSHVILRKKFRGYVSGSGAEVGSSDPPWVPVGKDAETAASNKPRQKPQQKEATGQQRVGFGPPSGVTPAPPHKATSPGSEALTGQRQPEAGVHAQRAPRRARNRPSYKTAVSRDDEEEKEEEVTVTKGSAGGTQPLSAPLNAPVRVTPAPPSGQRSYSQGTEGQMLTPRSPTRVILNNSNFDLRQQQAHSAPDQSIRPVTAQAVSHIPQKPQLKTPSLPTPPAPEQASKGGELRGGFGPLPGVTLASPHRETSPGPEVLTGMRQPEEDVHAQRAPRRSLVPLEPREHIWLVKAAAGNWPEIYTLFREEPSLLNKKDFISGFTVLHWVAKHGDHRVLNTLGYGIEKLSLTFDVNARSNSGHTPLHIAVMHGHKNIIRLLIKKFQANVKQRDMAGKRPWQYLSLDAPLEMFHLLAAPMQDVMTGKKGVEKANTSWEEQQKQSRRLRHHASSASGESPLTIASRTKVKRSTSLAAFLKHKSLIRFQGHQVDSSA
uniref:SOWAHA-C winged helix-turn-helix domain-containing protein n=1 Tax=Oreochromis aureus TaxID=47969 RepID=A0A668S987_OREAU